MKELDLFDACLDLFIETPLKKIEDVYTYLFEIGDVSFTISNTNNVEDCVLHVTQTQKKTPNHLKKHPASLMLPHRWKSYPKVCKQQQQPHPVH